MRIVRARLAQSDLDAIWAWIARDDPAAADGMIERLIAATNRLHDFPLSSQDRSELGSGLRSIPAWPYIIYLRVDEDCIRILRIVHGARDVGALKALG